MITIPIRKTVTLDWSLPIVLEHLNTSLTADIQITFAMGVEEQEGEVVFDLDFVEYRDIVYLGKSIEEGIPGWTKFQNSFKELGINIDTIFSEHILEYINARGSIAEQFTWVVEFLQKQEHWVK